MQKYLPFYAKIMGLVFMEVFIFRAVMEIDAFATIFYYK